MCGERVRFAHKGFEGTEAEANGSNRLDDIKTNCLDSFRAHWECLDNNNQQLWQCRKAERPLNKCVFEKLVRLLDYLQYHRLVADHECDAGPQKRDSGCTGKRSSDPPETVPDICTPGAEGEECRGRGPSLRRSNDWLIELARAWLHRKLHT